VGSWRQLLIGENPSPTQVALRLLLRLGSVPYFLAISARNWSYDRGWKKSYRSRLVVISVGNLSAGGTGKSPAVAWIARWLRQRGLRAAILSRGYGHLDDGRNDEALELELKFPDVPHLQNPDRVASARIAEDELEMQVLILDDGFQHRRLKRDLDIVLIDATDSANARRLLPAGLRREPLSSLSRADAVIWTRSDQVASAHLDLLVEQARQHAPKAEPIMAVHRPQAILAYPNQKRSLSELDGAKILAFCGIGNSNSFFNMLKDLGANLIDTHEWPDHHAYTSEDISWLCRWHAQDRDAKLVCTVKDWVKIQETLLGERELWAVAVELEITRGKEALDSMLEALVERMPSADASAE
jgi:tetraacyldisaccharide 4'-kinase